MTGTLSRRLVALRGWFAVVIERVLIEWPDRHRQRARLREMTPHQLRDIGLSQRAAWQEARKPFWR